MAMFHGYISQVMLLCLISVSGLFAGQDLLPAPENITMVSVNLNHILHWEAVSVIWGNVTYSVQIQGEFEDRYMNDSWFEIEHCQSIPDNQCNLTKDELANVFYNFRVRAELGNQTSDWNKLEPPFTRKSSLLIPPKFNLQVTGSQLITDIEDYGISFLYFVSFWKKGKEDEVKSIKINRNIRSPSIMEVEEGNEYCVQVIAYAIPINKNSSSSEACIQVPVRNHTAVFIGIFCMLLALVPLALGVWKVSNVIRYSCCPDEDIPDVLKEFIPHKMTRDNHYINQCEQMNDVELNETIIFQKSTCSSIVTTQLQ